MAVKSKRDNPAPFVIESEEPLITTIDEPADILFVEDEPNVSPIADLMIEDNTNTKPMLSPNVRVAPALLDIESMITSVEEGVEYLTTVVYGKNGTGKTTLLSTAENILIVAAEDGTLSIRNKLKNGRKIKIKTWAQLEAVYFMLKNGINSKNEIWINTKEGKFQVKYFAIDTVTKLAEICMRSMILDTRMKDKSGEIDLITKTLKDWGDMTEKMKYWLQLFEELPMQRIWTCQETTNSEDVEADEYSIYPALSKSLRSYVMSEADIIARTYIAKSDKTGGMVYRLTAVPNPTFATKDRTGSINSGAITSPDLTKIYKHIFKEVK